MEQFDKYVGQVFDRRYKINKIIGIGGMAVVFEAHDMLMNRTVAVKMLKEEIKQRRTVRQALHHTNPAPLPCSIIRISSISTMFPVKDDIKYIVPRNISTASR